MNFHSRSYSEQPQVAQATATPSVVTNGNGHQSFIRIHSDSQQSLDQLFNPTQNTVPLRNRNLPLSFFNPSVKSDILESSANNGQAQNARPASLHQRSISFDQHNQSQVNPMRQQNRPSFHMRTHSTIAPMPRLLSNDSSHQSSHEFINQPMTPSHEQATFSSSSTNLHQHNAVHSHSHSNSAWSSATNSMDNLNSPSWTVSQPSLGHNPNSQSMHINQQQQQQQQQQHQQAMQMTQNGSSPMIQQPVMSPSHSHQNIVYSSNGSGQTGGSQTIPEQHHQHGCANNFHSRSISFNPHPQARATSQHSFHGRTHSTIAPMSSSTLAPSNQHTVSNHSLHRSPQELNYPSNGINNNSATGWSSSGYSTDDMNGGGVHGWLANQNQLQHHSSMQQAPIARQAKPMEVNLHDDLHHHHHHHHNHNHNHHPHEHHSNHHDHHMQTQAQHQQAHQPHQQLFYHV